MNEWAGFLKLWGLTNGAITLLNGTRPFLIPLSQILVMSSPFFASKDTRVKLQKFIDMLEDDQASKEFATHLQAGIDLP